MSKEQIAAGDYVMVERMYEPFYALVTGVDEDGYYEIIDQDGDSDQWTVNEDTIQYVTKEEVEQRFIIILDVTGEDGYNGVIDFKYNILHVGCQEIQFSEVEKIYNYIKHLL